MGLFRDGNCPSRCELARSDAWYIYFDSEEDAQKVRLTVLCQPYCLSTAHTHTGSCHTKVHSIVNSSVARLIQEVLAQLHPQVGAPTVKWPSFIPLCSLQAYQFLREVVQEYKGSPLHVRLKEKVFQQVPPPQMPPFSNLSPRGPMPFQHPHAFPYMPRPPVSTQNMECGVRLFHIYWLG